MPDYITEHHGGGWRYQLHIPMALRPMLDGKTAFVRYLPRMSRREAAAMAREWAVQDAATIASCLELSREGRELIVEGGGLRTLWNTDFYAVQREGSLTEEATTKLSGQKLLAYGVQTAIEKKKAQPLKFEHSWNALFTEWQRVRTPRQTRDQEVTIHLLKDYFGERDCRKVTPQEIAKFRDHLLTTDTTRGMVHTRLKQIKAMFSGASQEPDSPFHGMPNPATGIKLLGEKPAVKEVLPFSPRQVRAIFEMVQTTGFGQDRNAEVLLLLRVIAFTGARPNEIAQLQGGDVREENGVKIIRIRQTDAITGQRHPQKSLKKKNNARDVPIHNEILDFFDYAAKFGPGDFIFGCFSWNLKFGRINYIGTRFADFLRNDCQIASSDPTRKYVLYSLRHTFIDAMRVANIPENEQDRLVGHAQSMTGRYGGTNLPLLQDYVNKLKIVE